MVVGTTSSTGALNGRVLDAVEDAVAEAPPPPEEVVVACVRAGAEHAAPANIATLAAVTTRDLAFMHAPIGFHPTLSMSEGRTESDTTAKVLAKP